MQTITLTEVKRLISLGMVVYPYPRKKIICVSGGKYYKASPEVLLEARRAIDQKKNKS